MTTPAPSKTNKPAGPKALTAAAFDSIKGTEYGGNAEILSFEVGDVHGPITYVGSKMIKTDLGEALSFTGTMAGVSYRLPIAATFRSAVDGAQLVSGDQFYVKREKDIKSFKFDRQGKDVAIYTVKVTERAGHDA